MDVPVQPIRFFTEDELDALEREDPDRAYRIARAQAMAQRLRPRGPVSGEPPDAATVAEAIDDVRRILQRDGGDIELVEIDGSVVRVRMKGACAGCPNSVIDLRNIVEKVVLGVAGVSAVVNVF
ncbi:MAG: NifU family protein [Gammaproteobacteria bacterium]|nr:NifU family protein [Gammaproteobacteria bacterium]